ncbi:hypothetical protein ACO0LG_08715 [Undibacterium sp. Ji42W]|uniref:hypothetical protein n=1 Tax=Undibacterium sp. Ji42W TaxID=3413039 RepID=UPI003BF36DF4
MPLNSVAQTDKYVIGDVTEMVGQSSFFKNKFGTWAQTGTWLSASNFLAPARAALKGGAYNLAAATDNIAVASHAAPYQYSMLLGAKSASVFVTSAVSGAAVLTVDANGYRPITTGLSTSTGTLCTYDGAKFWQWGTTSATAFGANSSTDGNTWAGETLTGQATFAGLTTLYPGTAGDQASNGANGLGELFYNGASSYIGVAAYCGARHLLVGLNGSNQYLAQRSTNGNAWGGDESTAILGSTTVGGVAYAWWYKTGNTFFLTVGNITRVTTDGGVTWSTPTGSPLTNSTNVRYRTNPTDPLKLMAVSVSSTTAAYSANAGASWTARTLPITPVTPGSFFTRGSLQVLCNQTVAYKSLDDGASWSQLLAPSGFTGPISAVYADANRWYMLSSISNQVAISTDLVTWVVRNISNPAPSAVAAYITPMTLASTDANTILGISPVNTIPCCLMSSDGGTTWYWGIGSSNATYTGLAAYAAAVTVGTPMFVGGGNAATYNTTACLLFALGSDIAIGGRQLRLSVNAVTPARANAFAYSRVA